ncbi:MAG: hypothetical protein ACYDBH_00535 [Acidobacteriaceae bacterium]
MTISTMTASINEGVNRREWGSISGTFTAATDTGSAGNASMNGSGVLTIQLGFVPKHIRLVNVTDTFEMEWFQGMASGNYITSLTAGGRTLNTDGNATTGLMVYTAATGTAPVTFEPVTTVTVAVGSIITDNDTTVWMIEG